jgi:hypothetical protein
MFISLFDTYVVVSLMDVEFGEYDGSAEITNEISNEWEGVLVTNCPSVDLSVVLYWSQLPVLLFDEEG